MKIVVTSDEVYPVNLYVVDWLKNQGHDVMLGGALKSQQNESWVTCAVDAAEMISQKKCDEGIFFCWTGTGVSITANRFSDIRAALCVDAETARAARIWNHANVLVLSNRLLSHDVAKEILEAWFQAYDVKKGEQYIKELMFKK